MKQFEKSGFGNSFTTTEKPSLNIEQMLLGLLISIVYVNDRRPA